MDASAIKNGREWTHPKVDVHLIPLWDPSSAPCREAMGTSGTPMTWWCSHGGKEPVSMFHPKKHSIGGGGGGGMPVPDNLRLWQ